MHIAQEILLMTADTLIECIIHMENKLDHPLIFKVLKALLQRSELTRPQILIGKLRRDTSSLIIFYQKVLSKSFTTVMEIFADSHKENELKKCALLILTLGYYNIPQV